jgi:hypothetical protein
MSAQKLNRRDENAVASGKLWKHVDFDFDRK